MTRSPDDSQREHDIKHTTKTAKVRFLQIVCVGNQRKNVIIAHLRGRLRNRRFLWARTQKVDCRDADDDACHLQT